MELAINFLWVLKPVLAYVLTISITAFIYNKIKNDNFKFTVAVGGGMIGTILFSFLAGIQ